MQTLVSLRKSFETIRMLFVMMMAVVVVVVVSMRRVFERAYVCVLPCDINWYVLVLTLKNAEREDTASPPLPTQIYFS